MMSKTYSAIVAMILLLATAASAQAEINSSSLKLRQIGESFNDLFFNLRNAFTFSDESRLELFHERAEELQIRQGSWLKSQKDAGEQYMMGVISAEERDDVFNIIKDEQERLMNDHTHLALDVDRIRVEARDEGNLEVVEKARTVALSIQVSHDGLNDTVNDSNFPIIISNSLPASIQDESQQDITSDEARIIADSHFGFSDSVIESERNGHHVFIVVGDEITDGARRHYELWIDRSGNINHIEINTESQDGNVRSSVRSESSGRDVTVYQNSSVENGKAHAEIVIT